MEWEHRLPSPINLIATLGGIFLVSQLAFSLKIRKKIGKRDNWHCQDDGCDESFQGGVMVHASHYNHSRQIPGYNKPGAGRIQCIDHHQDYHEEHVGHAEDIGLCEEANLHAINMLAGTERRKLKRR